MLKRDIDGAESTSRPHPGPARSGSGPRRGPMGLLDLQRLAGNRATTYAVRAADAAPVAQGAPVAQRAKSPEERGKKSQRVEFAKREIPPLAGSVPDNVARHMFDAAPLSGKLDKKKKPQGLHAYQGGRLPSGLEVLETIGSPTKVHTLRWRWAGSAKQKPDPGSTMFPVWMPRLHVLALISLRLGNTTPHPSAVETYIKRGARITLETSGDTVYPV